MFLSLVLLHNFILEYNLEDNLESVIKQPEQAVKLLLQWLSDNQMKANEHKCHVLISTKEKVCVNIRTTQITNSKCEKLLGIKIDSNLNFKDHIGFVASQFSYCPLTWMFHSRKPNNKINRLHERCLPVVYFNCKFILSIVFLSTINK